MLEIRKKIIAYKLNREEDWEDKNMKELNAIKYRTKTLHREFSYYYYNAIRLQNSFNENKNYFSYIGFIIIKNPEEIMTSKPDNFERNYELF